MRRWPPWPQASLPREPRGVRRNGILVLGHFSRRRSSASGEPPTRSPAHSLLLVNADRATLVASRRLSTPSRRAIAALRAASRGLDVRPRRAEHRDLPHKGDAAAVRRDGGGRAPAHRQHGAYLRTRRRCARSHHTTSVLAVRGLPYRTPLRGARRRGEVAALSELGRIVRDIRRAHGRGAAALERKLQVIVLMQLSRALSATRANIDELHTDAMDSRRR